MGYLKPIEGKPGMYIYKGPLPSDMSERVEKARLREIARRVRGMTRQAV